ncbi:hypothetical protein DWB84_10365 [Saccharophagus sp. K07]|jgi:hypothetical protein|uniref:hypothetical protein n=1 Tax=Saccharophagus sp. K07 TaxID=2283636 RepID=UPI0016526536|nr:hypothetical protein [Saccharophagus sp. K07]MBC6905860.1 hypothetical protein [Saccharophagus sp. K07]
MEPVSATLITFGVILLAFSWFYLMFVSFEEDFGWGLCAIFLPPLAYLYACFNWSKTQSILLLAVLGWILILIGW